MVTETAVTTIAGRKVAKPSKVELAREVARILGVEPPGVSRGSTVLSALLDRIYAALLGVAPGGRTAYEKLAGIMQEFDLVVDPHWDTSEASASGGGSTVTARAYSRMRTVLTGAPRCFVLNSTDAEVGRAWEIDKEKHYRYDARVTGRGSLNDAGPGSLVLFYNTSNHSRHPMSYTATARVKYIAPGWAGPWDAELTDYGEFADPVPASRVHVRGRNSQHAITEISWSQYREIVAAGSGRAPSETDDVVRGDLAGGRVAELVKEEFPADAAPVHGDPIPPMPNIGTLTPQAQREPDYESDEWRSTGLDLSGRRRSESERQRDKIAEERAVELVVRHLTSLGWKLIADRQSDAVGYDLELSDGDRTMHLEVKGVQGPRITFNLTAKEWWRTLTDPAFLLAAVTDVLSPSDARVNLIGSEELAAANRMATQYRVAVARR